MSGDFDGQRKDDRTSEINLTGREVRSTGTDYQLRRVALRSSIGLETELGRARDGIELSYEES